MATRIHVTVHVSENEMRPVRAAAGMTFDASETDTRIFEAWIRTVFEAYLATLR